MAAPSNKEVKDPEVPLLGPRSARLRRGPDVSQLRPPIKTSVSGTRQVIHALETSTREVKKLLLDEINLMYECKICHSVFRSLANLISHKRTFCKTKYAEVTHVYQDKEMSSCELQTVVIEAEPVECVVASQHSQDLISYSPSLELLKTAGILSELGGASGCVGPPTNRLLPPGRQSLGQVVAELKAKLQGTENQFMRNMKTNFETNRPQATVHLEPLFETRSAFQQTWRYSEDDCSSPPWPRTQSDSMRVGPNGDVMTNDHTVKLVTGPDGQSYSVRVPVADTNVRERVQCSLTEGGVANVKYPCPTCGKWFLQVRSVLRHLVSQHKLGITEARGLKQCVKNSGTVSEVKSRPVRVNDLDCRPVKPLQVKVQNLTLRLNGKINLCDQLATDQATVCPIIKAHLSDGTQANNQDTQEAAKVNRFVEEREAKELMESVVPEDVEAKIMEHVNRRRVQCRLCDKKFSRSLLAKQHVASVHLSLRRWTCSLCSFGCWSKQVCVEHVATQHRVTDVTAAVTEQPKAVYFEKYCSTTDQDLTNSNKEGAVENIETERRWQEAASGSNGLHSPEADTDTEDTEESCRGRGMKRRGERLENSFTKIKAISRDDWKEDVGSSSSDEDTEVTINIPANVSSHDVGEEEQEEPPTAEDVEGDWAQSSSRSSPRLEPRLLFKFSGSGSSATVNKVPPRSSSRSRSRAVDSPSPSSPTQISRHSSPLSRLKPKPGSKQNPKNN